MRYIPDWTEDNITRKYLDARYEHPENCTCFNCEINKENKNEDEECQ